MRNADENRTNKAERCHKCGDTPHMEGFRCPASRHRCKHCSKMDISVIYASGRNKKVHTRKIQETQWHTNYKLESTLQKIPYITKEDTDVSESEDSFCLQMQMKKSQADQESCDTQHLETNLHYKVKPYGKKTRIPRAKVDTCSNTNIMPVSTYKIIYNEPDCIQLQPSEKKGIQTYTKQKIPVIGSCELFVLHSDDQCFHKVKFQVVSIEGSVIISYATSINLNLIQIPKQLNI